ncbi:MAG TPA: hypothetical protein VKA89_10220 [Solirubrobacterales bacterium]|nr:hypothetical protein [Solirubrobacterales bacterium]
MEADQYQASDAARAVLAAQSLYYVTTGVWPIAHDRSFQAVTGPKVDVWLVKTFGALVTAVGGALGVAAARRRGSPETQTLALGAAAAMAGADAYYVARGRIPPVYLVDAAAQAALMAALLLSRSGGS